MSLQQKILVSPTRLPLVLSLYIAPSTISVKGVASVGFTASFASRGLVSSCCPGLWLCCLGHWDRGWAFLSPLEFPSTGSAAGEWKCRGRRGQVAAFPRLKPQPLRPAAPGTSTAERLELYARLPCRLQLSGAFSPRGMQFFSFIKNSHEGFLIHLESPWIPSIKTKLETNDWQQFNKFSNLLLLYIQDVLNEA